MWSKPKKLLKKWIRRIHVCYIMLKRTRKDGLSGNQLIISYPNI